MRELEKIKRSEAEDLINKYTPLFCYLESNNIDYCCCGGLAVLLHALQDSSIKNFRLTNDADIFLPKEFNEEALKEIYVAVYAVDEKTAQFIHDEIFGYNSYYDLLENYDDLNISIEGFGRTPNIDALKWLNGKSLDNINKVSVDFYGQKINIASIKDLIQIKESVINLYKGNFESRPKDYVDINLLKRLVDR